MDKQLYMDYLKTNKVFTDIEEFFNFVSTTILYLEFQDKYCKTLNVEPKIPPRFEFIKFTDQELKDYCENVKTNESLNQKMGRQASWSKIKNKIELNYLNMSNCGAMNIFHTIAHEYAHFIFGVSENTYGHLENKQKYRAWLSNKDEKIADSCAFKMLRTTMRENDIKFSDLDKSAKKEYILECKRNIQHLVYAPLGPMYAKKNKKNFQNKMDEVDKELKTLRDYMKESKALIEYYTKLSEQFSQDSPEYKECWEKFKEEDEQLAKKYNIYEPDPEDVFGDKNNNQNNNTNQPS